MSIDAVFLDIGGVVLEIDWKHTVQRLGSRNQTEDFVRKIAHWDHFHEFERGKVTPESFFTEMKKLFDLNLSHAELQSAWNEVLVGHLPGIENVFDALKSKVPVYALSNTNVVHFDYFQSQFSICARFDCIYTSFGLGHRKPDAEIYWAAAQNAGVKPEQAIFIDDLSMNVEAARKVGFHAYQTVNSPPRTLAAIRQHLQL